MSLIEKGRPGGASPYRARKPRRRLPLLLVLVAALGLAALWWLRPGDRVLEPLPAPAEEPIAEAQPLGAADPQPVEPEAEPAAEPEAPPVPAEPLPPLARSDDLARTLARGVSGHPLVAAALEEAGVIERFVVAVDQLAEGNAPRRDLEFLRPKGRFQVLTEGEPREPGLGLEPDLRIDPGSYRRYDALAGAFAALDAKALVAAYRRLAPLCEEAYRALGYPEGGFEQRLREALALLASTPRIDETPALVAEVKRYEFADPNLESLPDAQKQLLRMGPENQQRIVDKLREIEAALR